jgi:hypothetical protein
MIARKTNSELEQGYIWVPYIIKSEPVIVNNKGYFRKKKKAYKINRILKENHSN